MMPESNPHPVQAFLDYLRLEKRFSPHTVTAYRTDLRDFFDHLEQHFGKMPVEAIAQRFIRDWLASLRASGISPRSINRKISSLRSFFNYLLKSGLVRVSPLYNLSGPKAGKRLPVFVKEKEASALLQDLASVTEDWKSLNAKMLLTLFYTTGMRLSELINMEEKFVDFSRAQIKVLGKGNKERIIPVSREVIEMIREYQRLRKKEFASHVPQLLVTEKGKKLYPKYVYLMVKAYLGGASTLDKKSPHVLRHTFATHLLNSGADLNAVKELLGHSSLASTQVYTHNTIEKLKNVYKKAHPKA